jgi:UrcA family protein
MKAILTATWAAVMFITSIPVSAAQPEWDTRSVRVDYSDLDLTGVSGVSTLDHRVTGAIRQVCDGPAFELREKMQQRACERGAGTTASKDVQSAISTAKQQSSTKAGTAVGTIDRTISGSSQTRHNRQNLIPRR